MHKSRSFVGNIERADMRILAEETICMVIDYQEKLVPAVAEREEFLSTSIKFLHGMQVLGIPRILTTQYKKGLGDNISSIKEAAGEAKEFDKISFSAWGQEELKKALPEHCKNVLICGMEAHICVLQTALDLKEAGYRPVLVADCITARNLKDKEIAFLRARMEGVTFTTYESILYELSQVAGTDSFKQISAIIKS